MSNQSTRITMWIEKDKPTKVKTTKSEVFFLAEDLAQMSLREVAERVTKQTAIRPDNK